MISQKNDKGLAKDMGTLALIISGLSAICAFTMLRIFGYAFTDNIWLDIVIIIGISLLIGIYIAIVLYFIAKKSKYAYTIHLLILLSWVLYQLYELVNKGF